MAEMLLWTNSRATSILRGDFSVKTNLESAKESSQYLHMPTESCCCLCCCAFRIRFSQVKVIHLQWSAWMPAIISQQGFWGPGEESREHTLHTTCEAGNALWKKEEEYIADSQMAPFLNSFLPNFVSLSSLSNLTASFSLRISSA